MGTIFSATPLTLPAGVEYVTCEEFYNCQCNYRMFFSVIDCRSMKSFTSSHLDLALHHATAMGILDAHTLRTSDALFFYGGGESSDLSTEIAAMNLMLRLKLKHSYKFQIFHISEPFSVYKDRFPYLCTDSSVYEPGVLHASRIEGDHLFLSNYGVASNPAVLRNLGITHILNCTVDLPFPEGWSLDRCLRVPVVDDSDVQIQAYFSSSIPFIDQALGVDGVDEEVEGVAGSSPSPPRGMGKVLVHCKHGQSRSATVLAAWLISRRGHSVQSALSLLKSRRPIVRPNHGFVSQLELHAERVQSVFVDKSTHIAVS